MLAKQKIIDVENLKIIENYTSKNNKVIIAWGNDPTGLSKQYHILKENIFKILEKNKNEVFFVDKISNFKNPKHAQVWGHDNALKKYSDYKLAK